VKKYVCTVCGYIYDEAIGNPENGIKPGTKWEDIPEDWTCPLCGAGKSEFEEQAANEKPDTAKGNISREDKHGLREFSFGEMSALFSNLAKGSEKQYRVEEAERFNELAEYYKSISKSTGNEQLSDISDLVRQNLNTDYSHANVIAEKYSDSGALRALVWSEKVTRILFSILNRYEKQKTELLKNKNIYVCEICGFVYLGDKPPQICPVCKVPNLKIGIVQKEAI